MDCAWEIERETGRVVSPLARDSDTWRSDTGIGRVIAREGRPW